jgi:hypothetical protein
MRRDREESRSVGSKNKMKHGAGGALTDRRGKSVLLGCTWQGSRGATVPMKVARRAWDQHLFDSFYSASPVGERAVGAASLGIRPYRHC